MADPASRSHAPSGPSGPSGPSDEPSTAPLRRAPSAPGDASLAPPLSATDPGQRYVRTASLGGGAMGSVDLCHDRRIGRDVAVKVIRSELAHDAVSRVRFEREARVQGQLEHPAIVPVYDLGVDDAGAAFFTMKRVQGESLREILAGLRRGDPEIAARYTRGRLLGAFATVALAVAFAHARGVVHRDIKPGNVMLGAYGEVYLLDWGLAKVSAPSDVSLDATSEVAAVEVPPAFLGVTVAGDVLGTLGYMAPEQVRGEAADAHSDVYALGAMLFEILALEPLHARIPATAVASTLRGVDARPSSRGAVRVPPALEELCVRATAIDPHARGEARAMADVVLAVLDGDRDDERARARAADHAAQARTALVVTLGSGDPEARARAVDEAHRAIALDPTNRDAFAVLTQLALAPAGHMPPDADRALQASTSRMRLLLARTGVLLYVPWLVGLAYATLLGVRHEGAMAVATLVVAVGAALAYWRTRVESVAVTFAALVAADAAAAFTGAAFGPFVLVPALLGCVTLAFTIGTTPRPLEGKPGAAFVRVGAIVAAVVAFLVPVLLEVTGVVAPSIAFRDGAVVLLPRVVDFPPTLTLAFLVVTNLLVALVPAAIATQVRDHALATERTAFASAARLHGLLPREAQAALVAKAESVRPRP